MITEQAFRGNADRIVLNGAAVTLNRRARLWRIDLGSGMAVVKLPDARGYQRGVSLFVIINATGNSLTIQNNASGSFQTLAANKAVIVNLIDNTSQAGVWTGAVRDWSAA